MFDKTKIKTGVTASAPRIVLVGVPGVGKTTAGAQCPAPIFLSAEDGLVGQGYDDIPHYTPDNWDDVMDFLKFVATEQHDYKSLVIDTIDWLEPKLYAYVCKRDKKTDIEAYGYGKGHTAAADEFRRALALLDTIHKRGMVVVINTHCHIKAFQNPIGDNYDRYELKCTTKQIAGMITEWADAVLFAQYEVYTVKSTGETKAKGVGGEKRVVQTAYSAGWCAKNRCNLPAVLPLDMPTIIDAMKSGNTSTAEEIVAEITAMMPRLPQDKRDAVVAFVDKNKTKPVELLKMKNRIITLTAGGNE